MIILYYLLVKLVYLKIEQYFFAFCYFLSLLRSKLLYLSSMEVYCMWDKMSGIIRQNDIVQPSREYPSFRNFRTGLLFQTAQHYHLFSRPQLTDFAHITESSDLIGLLSLCYKNESFISHEQHHFGFCGFFLSHPLVFNISFYCKHMNESI